MAIVFQRRTGRLIIDNIARQDYYHERRDLFNNKLFDGQIVHILTEQSMKSWFAGEDLIEYERYPSLGFNTDWNVPIAINYLKKMQIPHFDFYSGQSHVPKDGKPHGQFGERIGIVVEPKKSRRLVRSMLAAQSVYESWRANRGLMDRLFGGTLTYPDHLPNQARAAFQAAFESEP